MFSIPFVLVLLPPLALSKVQSGDFTSLTSSSGWHYLARFCFRPGNDHSTTSDERRLSWEVKFSRDMCCPILNIYYDTDHQWHGVYRSNLSCVGRVAKARARIPLTEPTCVLDKDSNTYKCKGFRYIYSNRPRWWYLALSNCDSPGYNLDYSLTFTNGDSFLDRQFSADELGIMEMNFFSICTTAILIGGTLIYTRLLKLRKFYHVTFKTYQASLIFYCLSCILLAIYYTLIGAEGTAPIHLYVIAQTLLVISTTCFLGLLLMFSKGYSIVVSALTTQSFTEVMLFTATFAMLMLYCVIWEQGAFDPADVVYLYQSPPGYMLTGLYVAAWFYFILNCVRVGIKFAGKRSFYSVLGGFYSLWLLVVPLVIVVCNTVVKDYSRMKTVFICQQIIWLMSYLYMFILFNPSRSNKHFPFHLRSTQVSDGTGIQGGENNYNVSQDRETGDIFRVGYDSQGPYEPASLGHKGPTDQKQENGLVIKNGVNENGGHVNGFIPIEGAGNQVKQDHSGAARFGNLESDTEHVYDNDERGNRNGIKLVSVMSNSSDLNNTDTDVNANFNT